MKENENSVYNALSEWQILINNQHIDRTDDFWIENNYGKFKNPQIITQDDIGINDPLNISFTIIYDVWVKPNANDK